MAVKTVDLGSVVGPQGPKGDPGEDANVTVDSALSSTSKNPVQNKVVNAALAGKAASSHNHSASSITSGTLAAARLPLATQSANGAMSAADKKKLDALSDNGAYVTLYESDAGTREASVPGAEDFDLLRVTVGVVATTSEEFVTSTHEVIPGRRAAVSVTFVSLAYFSIANTLALEGGALSFESSDYAITMFDGVISDSTTETMKILRVVGVRL